MHGGVGKTAVVLESVKQIVQDLQDDNTENNYKPDFLLFFTAKEEALTISSTSGKIQSIKKRTTFRTADELVANIFSYLKITSFAGFKGRGLIIIDNLESLSSEDRSRVEEFICYNSPQEVQYIITSRNEENYESRNKLAGFDDDDSGNDFIKKYLEENNYDVALKPEEVRRLLQVAMGNTLVLVLCLRRLSMNLATIDGITADISRPTTVKSLQNEIQQIPANGFDIISEYMFKNSFQEIQEKYKSHSALLSQVLQIFAVYPTDRIDLYTISMLSKKPYAVIDPILELLCRYLIIEKQGDTYSLNQFAGKYIIQLFLPDAETYGRIEREIVSSTRKIQDELSSLQNDINNNISLRRIIHDWAVISDGDKIAAARAYKLYGDVWDDCRSESRYHIESSFQEVLESMRSLEQNTMHPYIKVQMARILQMLADTKVLDIDFYDQIIQAYNDTIWAIKSNPIYSSIREQSHMPLYFAFLV